MASIYLSDVSVEFPIYNINARSLKKRFLRIATGGDLVEDVKNHVVVNALQHISFMLKEGDRVGLIGHNGSGKSTLLRLLARIYEPTLGNIKIDGHVSPLLDLTHGIEAEFTGIENIVIRGTMLGLTRDQIQEKIAAIADFSGLGHYLSMPARTYSNGMFLRLAFAISTSIKPNILLIDEIFGTGDADFMEKAKHKMICLLEQSSIVMMASHSDALIREFCNRCLLLESGQLKYFGDTEEAFKQYYGKNENASF